MSVDKKIVCFACGAQVPEMKGPTHPYMLSAPGCWYLYGEILAKEYTPTFYDSKIHGITVDSYAVTHSGDKKDPRALRSVNIHLIRLYYTYSVSTDDDALLQIITNAANDEKLQKEFQWLKPPSFIATLHITDLLNTSTPQEHKMLVNKWGKSVWTVWNNLYGNYIEDLALKLSS